jgi:hypothetical protein
MYGDGDVAVFGHSGMYLQGFAGDDENPFLNLTAARARCVQLGDLCSGVTWESSEVWEEGNGEGGWEWGPTLPLGNFTVRASANLTESEKGEITWLKSEGGVDNTTDLPPPVVYHRRDGYNGVNFNGNFL